VHPNNKASSSYFAQPLSIATAAQGSPLKSEGVGEMKLFSRDGTPIDGFSRTIFCKGISEKLCSVGELCNAGNVVVFDEEKVTLYKKSEKFSVNGKILCTEKRNLRTGLYPISFYRKPPPGGEKVEEKTQKREREPEPMVMIVSTRNFLCTFSPSTKFSSDGA
jgi:hypothetical protein